MDPSRIQLEDDRFGLIGVSFRPQNRATFLGMDDGDYVWSVGIVVGDEDEIQTVEIDDHGAKSSRMLTPGELFEGLQILGQPGSESYLIVGALTLLGMDLRSSTAETAHEFAEVLRAAAEDRSWRLPLHLIGQPRDLQLSNQGRDILRQTASALEQEGHARTSLAAAQRLELSGSALDSIRRRIARKSLQAYRMHGRWYVVLDNLTRSRASEQNGTHAATSPSVSAPTPTISPFEEIPESAVEAQAEPEVEEPFVPVEEETEEAAVQEVGSEETAVTEAKSATAEEYVAPTEEDLAAFVSEEPQPEESVEASAASEAEPEQPEPTAEAATAEPEEPGISDEMLQTEADAEEQAAREDLAREAGLAALPAVEGQPEQAGQAPVPPAIDQFLSESVMEQFIVAEIDSYIREFHPAEEESAAAPTEPEAVSEEAAAAETVVEPEAEAVAAAESTEAQPESEPEPQAETEPGEAEFILTAEEPADIAAEAESAEEAEPAPEEFASATEEASATFVEAPSAEPEAESVVSETTKSAEEVEPEPLATEPLGESGEPVAETAEPAEGGETEPAPIDAESAEALEEPVESEPEAPVAEAAAEPQETVESEDVVAEATQPEESIAEAPASEEPVEAEEPEESASGETEEEAPRQLTAEEIDLLSHLREEVAFLRQQGQEKDRQIVAWINGGQWLQPFVDQIHSLEQQVERLGEMQAKRDSDRIADLASERDRLRERLNQLETEIAAARTAEPNARRSWFRRMMGSN